MTGRCDLISGRQVLGGFAALAALAASWALAGDAVSAQVEPPGRGEPIETVWFSVGDVREVDMSAAFVGPVDSYTATSDNEAAVSVSLAGSVVSLTAAGAGVAFVEVRAVNEGGSVSQWIGVVSTAAAEEDDGVVDDGVVDDGVVDGVVDDAWWTTTRTRRLHRTTARPATVTRRRLKPAQSRRRLRSLWLPRRTARDPPRT